MAMATSTTTSALWKNRSFLSLWSGTILSAVADGAFFCCCRGLSSTGPGRKRCSEPPSSACRFPACCSCSPEVSPPTAGIGNGSCSALFSRAVSFCSASALLCKTSPVRGCTCSSTGSPPCSGRSTLFLAGAQFDFALAGVARAARFRQQPDGNFPADQHGRRACRLRCADSHGRLPAHVSHFGGGLFRWGDLFVRFAPVSSAKRIACPAAGRSGFRQKLLLPGHLERHPLYVQHPDLDDDFDDLARHQHDVFRADQHGHSAPRQRPGLGRKRLQLP